jgi:helicase
MNKPKIIESNQILRTTKENFVDLTLNTIYKGKQVLIFNNSKNSSEATAEKVAIANKRVGNAKELEVLANKILKSLQSPTRQCRRLAKCIQKGTAFHHSGLTGKQRTLVETNFKSGLIKVISSTPTLAAGLNLPAYKVIIKDYKRFSSRGMADIPVLEFHQMAGRAGRPGKEDTGRAVVLVKSKDEEDRVIKKYIFGKSEEIFSKLAVEPTLKMYLLSLISMDMINSKTEIKDFFKNTLYAKQYQDLEGLYFNVFKILSTLKGYKFIDQQDDYYRATRLGKRVSELYLNPDTANYFLESLEELEGIFSKEIYNDYDTYKLIHFMTNALEMRPLFRVLKSEEDIYMAKVSDLGDDMVTEYDPFEMDYRELMQTFKTSDILQDWISEKTEDDICEKYKTTPGELNYKLSNLDWLLYSLEEFAHLQKMHFFKNVIKKLRIRFKSGVKEEIISLVSIKGIGRVRARKLFESNIKTYTDIKKVSYRRLEELIGKAVAKKLKDEIGNEYSVNDQIAYSKSKPTQIKVREVSHEEVDELVEVHVGYQRQKEQQAIKEKQNTLLQFF